MAKYNREFLVPYLQNICALHLALGKVHETYSSSIAYKQRLERGYYSATQPSKPIKHEEFVCEIGGICGAIGVIAYLFLSFGNDWLSKIILFVFPGVPSFSAVLIYIAYQFKARKKLKSDMIQYEKALDEYSRAQIANQEKVSSELPKINSDIQFLAREIKRIESILKRAYQANIIPSRYRNTYAAIYLYDWFSTSQADDLDAALNIFVLEEIKDRLDTIIANQSDMILNQRIMLANQQKSIEQQQRHSAIMRSKLDRIATSNEERNIYLSMIESNTAATAYFAAADYIRKL